MSCRTQKNGDFLMKKLIHNFIHCGILGWCMEITFTALDSFRRRQFTLKGITSIWMFPIYGMASFLAPLCRLLKGKNILVRGFAYASCIFLGEYITGKLLKKKGICPWDYSKAKWNVDGIIRLDYAPNWFLALIHIVKLPCRRAADIQRIQRPSAHPRLFRSVQNKIFNLLRHADMLQHQFRMGRISRKTNDGTQSENPFKKACRKLYVLYLIHITVIFNFFNESGVKRNHIIFYRIYGESKRQAEKHPSFSLYVISPDALVCSILLFPFLCCQLNASF